MALIPYFYESLNRNGIVIKGRQPLLNWVNTLYPGRPLNTFTEGTIYLIREMDSNELIADWVRANFDEIFINELNNWNIDENSWPAKRSYDLFREWFEVEIHSMVLDLEEEEIEKE